MVMMGFRIIESAIYDFLATIPEPLRGMVTICRKQKISYLAVGHLLL